MKEIDFMGLSSGIEDNTEFIPLLSSEDEEQMEKENLPTELPLLPLRNTVLFPGVVIPITVGRDKSIKLVKDSYDGDKVIGVVSQQDQTIEDPSLEQLNKIGTMAKIIKMLRMPDGNTTIIIQGKRRFEIESLTQLEPYMKAKINACDDVKPLPEDPEFDPLVNSVKDLSIEIIKKSPEIPTEATLAIKNIESPTFLINFVASNMNANVDEKQRILEENNISDRAKRTLRFLTKEIQLIEIKNDIQSKVKFDLDKQQKDYFLQQQMRQIQEELGGNPQDQEIEEILLNAEKKKWSKKIKEHFEKEVTKIQRMNAQSMEYSVQLNYLELLVELPWEEYTKDNFNLNRAAKILSRDHYGLEKIKDRIIEHLAVLKLKGDMKSPILCFAGPPGVGKTSLGKSIAEALDREYVRISLGGLRDEAEIRGHRKTYIGAMPGRIIQSIKKAKSSNPVFILDEIDKVGASHQGDPSSALLEVLDPEQNETFYDNYVEAEFDLSKVMFIATANDLSQIQPALRDRMEIIQLSGYTVEEKVEIAKKHLLPKQIKEHGLAKDKVKLAKKDLEALIVGYTRESGVRGLEKVVAKVVRKVATRIAREEEVDSNVTSDLFFDMLGTAMLRDQYENNDVAGVVTGLAWTSVGGDILFIESSITKGKGKLTLTGNLGDVMKESAVIALEFLKAHSSYLGLEQEVFDRYNVHVHVPEGATPKDGPSAGITMLTSLASLFTQRKVKSKLAMTGEITLRGRVLPVGGIKEKILAAKRANIKEIILCAENEKDILEIDQKYLKGLTFNYVKTMREVLDLALLNTKVTDAIEIK
ncbi:MAG: endopeptidase La [Salibacteraceae bacterium]